MRAMILAAGRGKRMAHLTNEMPKPLLRVKDRYLIEYPIYSLAKIGITEIIINIAYLQEQIKTALGDGSRYGVNIQYSVEQEALETGGGIFRALPLLGKDPFIVMSCDIISEYPLQNLIKNLTQLAHIVLVNNPDFHPDGDFYLQGNNVLHEGEKKLTFANIGIYRPKLFEHCQPGKFRLGDVLKTAIQNNQVTGEHYSGMWHNLGTPAQLQIVENDKHVQ
ncbi:MAG: nucleotidyltransferase family protein [Gammaproteobacteria bacterium]|nr:nucleotidyltransferase family protein [Gammaproteobacteria bacterium]